MNLPDMPEIILRRIWQEQSFTSDHLATIDGKTVRIVSPGTANTDGGPDFLNAKISIGNITFFGDVELHINANEWLSHKHNSNPHYNTVILHVVLTADPLSPPARTASKRAIPLLVLHPFLDETFHRAWEKALLHDSVPSSGSLPCNELNDQVPATVMLDWIEKLGRERIELKVRRFEERLKQLVDESRNVVREPYPRYYGNPAEIPVPKKDYTKRDFTERALWEQLLYEGMMEALGYSKNTRPFLTLARSMRLNHLRQHSLIDTPTMMAMLFGAAGLLPSLTNIREKDSRSYVLQLKKRWKQLRPDFNGEVLNEADWLFFRLRPSNFPTARLAAICFLLPNLFDDGAFRRLIGIFKSETLTNKQRSAQLHELFSFEPDEFWKSHFHFKGRIRNDPDEKTGTRIAGKHRTTVGAARIHDIIVNTLIPIVLLYARHFNDNASRRNARLLLAHLSPAQDNSVVEVIRDQLLKKRGAIHSSLREQGAIQLFRFYCSHARCAECAVGRTIPLLHNS